MSDPSRSSHSTAPRAAVRVALIGMVIGVMVMVITVCVVVGFKQTVTERVAGFGAHIQVVNFDNNNTYEMQPIAPSDTLIAHLRTLPNIESVSPFLTKPGMMKTDSAFRGVVLRATDDTRFYETCLTAGTMPDSTNEVLLSTTLADALQVGVDDRVFCYFVGDRMQVRRLVISGLYESGFGDADNLFVLGDAAMIRQLNDWEPQQMSGLEIRVRDVSYLNESADAVYFATANRLDREGNGMYVQTLEQLNPQIFAWLDLLDMNVVIIIVLMLLVSGFSIISGLIILILDSVQLIGTLKALGANNRFVRRIFVTEATMLVGRGMLYGNLLGLGLCALQYFTHLIPLDAATYYVNYVPIAFAWGWWLLLNIGTILVSVLILLAPSAIVTRISPAEVMRFE